MVKKTKQQPQTKKTLPMLCNPFNLSLQANKQDNHKVFGAALDSTFTVFKQNELLKIVS